MKKMEGLKKPAWAKHKKNTHFGKNGYNKQIRHNTKKELLKDK